MIDAKLSISADARRLVFSFYGATRTSDIHVWDLESDDLRAVTRASHGGLSPDAFVPPELVHYPTFDDRQVPAWFYRPEPQAEPAPAVVVVHGGPEGQSRPSLSFLAQYLVRHGYAVLVPNVRGSTGYGNGSCLMKDAMALLTASILLSCPASCISRSNVFSSIDMVVRITRVSPVSLKFMSGSPS